VNLNEYVPRSVFTPLHNRDKRWVCVVAHRRCGKTVAMCADLVIGALETALPKPQFAYMAPQRDQAKRVAWTYLKDLTRPMWSKPPNESELKITINNGHGGESTIYVAGADNYDALRGMYFDGVVLDEVGQIRPSAWYKVLRPALSDRRGWAIFAGTPAGKNMFWNLREEARMNPSTHMLLELPASKTGIIHPDELRDAKAQMTEDAFAVEYECSFDAAVPGAYFAKQIGEAYNEGRIGKHPVDPAFPVNLVADLGFTDSCSWWGWQDTRDGTRIVDFMEDDNQPIQFYIDWVKSRPYLVNPKGIFLPHDAKAKSLQTGKSIVEQLAAQLDIANLAVVPDIGVQNGIQAVRMMLPRVWFDAERCSDGIEALRQYQREYDEDKKAFRQSPRHDFSSHPSDAFRMVAVSWSEVADKPPAPEAKPLIVGPENTVTLNDMWAVHDRTPSKRARI